MSSCYMPRVYDMGVLMKKMDRDYEDVNQYWNFEAGEIFFLVDNTITMKKTWTPLYALIRDRDAQKLERNFRRKAGQLFRMKELFFNKQEDDFYVYHGPIDADFNLRCKL